LALSKGISPSDYEQLPADTKTKLVASLNAIKEELRHRSFSLKFLGHSGRWDELTPRKFLALSEDHYIRLIGGAKWVRRQPRGDILKQISELYRIARHAPELRDQGLERWSKETELV
jgi:hypothetical protein